MANRQSRAPRRDLKRAARFVDAIQYVAGIMSVVLVEQYGWTAEEVGALVAEMQERLEKEKDAAD